MRAGTLVIALQVSLLLSGASGVVSVAQTSPPVPDLSFGTHPHAENSRDSFKSKTTDRVRQKESAPASLSGSASYTSTHADKDFEIGLKALDNRLYGQARQRLTRALTAMNKSNQPLHIKQTLHLALTETYLGLNNLDKARLNLEEIRSACQPGAGVDSTISARYFLDLAELYLCQGKSRLAEEAANHCLHELPRSAKPPLLEAQALIIRGRALLGQAYFEEARDEFKKALPALELTPGKDRLLYASALEGLALTEKRLGNEQESAHLMTTALALKDDAVVLDKTPDQKGTVKFDWSEGMYGSRQIIDPVYPLKYMVIGNLRVACTLVRSYKHVGVLISMANCSKHPLQLAVGAVELEKTLPSTKLLSFCDPGFLDEVLEEDAVLDRTWRRQTLRHIQKSCRIPGYLKNGELDLDDFFGNNQWGLYGAWDSHLRDQSPIVPRDQLFFDERPKNTDQEILGFMRGNAQIRPTFIETGEAKTGIVFFLRERYEDALVRLFIGNAELHFPFHTPPGQ